MDIMKSLHELAEDISKRAKQKRIRLNITQRELAERSGVSFGSVKRFEQKGEISLKHLLQIAIVLRSTEDFESLFKQSGYQSVDDVIREKQSQVRKRAGRNDT
ncbi:MAG: helix-turn-helix domain-containing protein [Bacteroidota bacterium]